MIRWLIFTVVYLALGFYVLQALKTIAKQPWWSYIYIVISLGVMVNFIYQFTVGEETGRVLSISKSYAFGFLLTVLTFSIITILFLFSEDLYRISTGLYQKFFGVEKEFSLPARRRFLSIRYMQKTAYIQYWVTMTMVIIFHGKQKTLKNKTLKI